MIKRFCIPVIIAMLCQLSIAAASPELLFKVTSDRIYYDVSETLRGTVNIENSDTKPREIEIVAWLEADLDKKTDKQVKQIAIKPGDRAEVTFEWPNAALGLYGYALRCQLLENKQVIYASTDYFTVCDNFWNVALMFGHPVAYTALYKRKQIIDRLTQLRGEFYNGFEKFFWAPDDFANMTPSEKVYYSGQARYYESVENLKYMIGEGHRLGMRAITYGKNMGGGTAGAAFARAHPEMVYIKDGRLRIEAKVRDLHYWDAEKNWAGKEGFRWQSTNWVFYNMNRPEVIDYGSDEIARSATIFKWDGVRFDGHFAAQSKWQDITGKVHQLTPDETDALTASNIRRMKQRIRKTHPKFVFGYNYLHDGAANRLASGSREFAELCRDGGHIMNEYAGQAKDVNHPWHRWEDWVQGITDDAQMVKRFGGHYFPILHYRGVDLWYTNAVTYAAGAHPYYNHVWGAFATRYAGILWDRQLRRINNPAGVVVAPLNLWWRRFVHQRSINERHTQVVVHLINPPIKPAIHNDAKDDTFPKPVRNIPVQFYPEAIDGGRWKLTRARLLDPDNVTQTNLTIHDDHGTATVTVPELRIWQVLVFDLEAR